MQNIRRVARTPAQQLAAKWTAWEALCNALCQSIFGPGSDSATGIATAAARGAQCFSIKQPYATLV
eukprot:2413472-Rhodomonas_salina.1